MVIDPGAEPETIFSFLSAQQLSAHCTCIVNTHGHADHIGANADLKRMLKVPLYIHRADAQMLVDAHKNLSAFISFPVVSPPADRFLSDGDVLQLGNETLTVIETPGHSKGSVCLCAKDVLFSGDTLFYGSIGRTDFPDSSDEDMRQSLQKLKTLDPNLVVYPGHGPATTLRRELEENPFLRGTTK